MGKSRKAENYLDMIPSHNPKLNWERDEKNKVTILIENKGAFNRIAQKLLKKPKVSQVHLEEMGSFIWPLIDGKLSVYDIAQRVEQKFGKKAEPLYERLVSYMHTMERYGFIQLTSSREAVQK